MERHNQLQVAPPQRLCWATRRSRRNLKPPDVHERYRFSPPATSEHPNIHTACECAIPALTCISGQLQRTVLKSRPSINSRRKWLLIQVLARSRATVSRADGSLEEYKPSVAVVKRLASRWPKPKWHAPWKAYRVISGHLGWVSSLAFDPGNQWFATGSADRTIKIWDMASGQLKLTLTGHTEQVMGLGVSDKFTYMFSCGLDKKVMCWDLETNKVRS